MTYNVFGGTLNLAQPQPPKFIPTSLPWKQVQLRWNFNTVCRMVSIHIPAFFGNLTYDHKITALQNFSL